MTCFLYHQGFHPLESTLSHVISLFIPKEILENWDTECINLSFFLLNAEITCIIVWICTFKQIQNHVSFHKAFTIINYHMCVSLECIQVIFACKFVISQYLIKLNAIFHKNVILLFHLSGHICIQRRSNAWGSQIWLWIMLIFSYFTVAQAKFLSLTTHTAVTLSRHADEYGLCFAGLDEYFFSW